jgi:hypothetical protein
MRAKEQQDDFNMKLMQSLNIIEKKLDKESGSCKSGSHGSPNEKIISRSVIKHHHHFLRNSNKISHRSACPSPIRKHKGSGVDEIQ